MEEEDREEVEEEEEERGRGKRRRFRTERSRRRSRRRRKNRNRAEEGDEDEEEEEEEEEERESCRSEVLRIERRSGRSGEHVVSLKQRVVWCNYSLDTVVFQTASLGSCVQTEQSLFRGCLPSLLVNPQRSELRLM